MRYFLGLACFLVVWPAAPTAPGAEPSPRPVESLLAADVAAYFRYDGYYPHQKAYDGTALGKAMKEDLGEFLEYLATFLTETITTYLQERNPGEMQKLAAGWKDLADYGWRHGLAAGVEISRKPGGFPVAGVPTSVRLTLVFPEGGTGKNRAILAPLLSVLAGDQTVQISGRTVHMRLDKENDYSVTWWQEGPHVVLVLGNRPIDEPVAVAEGRRPSLLTNPLLGDVAGFKDYETDIRGFVNVRKVVDWLRGPGDSDSKLSQVQEWLTRSTALNQIGLSSVESVLFHLGFDRQYQRSTIVAHVAEPERRAGLARLVFGPLTFDAKSLPSLPPDAASVRVSHLDWKAIHDFSRPITWLLGVQAALDGTGAPMNGALDLGVDVPGEILAHLDSTLVLYNSFSEGPFFLGQGAAIKVKDEKKLDEGLQKLLRKLGDKIGGGIQQQTYRGVDMVHYTPAIPFLPVMPAYTIHKGWLVIGAFPQSVKGYILRSEGNHRVWQAPPLLAEALAL
ncbi:MAG TPA: hypothetical protein VNX28_08820, partial [Gemmataceae bacterium]|nr:hypothetical protein [Gemmataceae bacterium]